MRGDTLLIVKCLGSRIKTWQERPDGVLLLPSEAFFDEAVAYTYRSFTTLLERMVEFTALVVVVPRGAMTAQAASLYRRLKGMECTLSWRGLVKPNPRFIALPRPEAWKHYMRKVKPDTRLVKALNAHRPLVDTIRRLKPAEVTVILQSLHSSTLHDMSKPQEVVQAMAEFYDEPTTVTWGILLRSALPHLSDNKATLNRCYDLLNLASKIVREISEASKHEVSHELPPKSPRPCAT